MMAAVTCLFLVLTLGQQAGETGVPLWQVEPFDRISLIDGKVHVIRPDRLTEPFPTPPEPDAYIGVPGLPPPDRIDRRAQYRIHRLEDGVDYLVAGRSIRKLERYEDMLLDEAKKLVERQRFDDAYRFLETVHDRIPDWPGLLDARVLFHYEAATVQAREGDFDRAFWALIEERRLRQLLDARGGKQPIARGGTDRPVEQRIDDLVDRWGRRLVETNRPAELRRLIALLESQFPDNPRIPRFREELGRRADQAVEAGRSALASGRWTEALDQADRAAGIEPGLESVHQLLEEVGTKYPQLRVAVESLPTFRWYYAAWSPADLRAAELIHLPLMRFAGTPENPEWASELLTELEKVDFNRRAVAKLRGGMVWPSDSKPVTVMDVDRLLTNACQSGQPFYHPALASLITRIEPVLPDLIGLDFDRRQFSPGMWLQLPLVRMGRSGAGGEGGAAGRARFAEGLGPFLRSRVEADRIHHHANPQFLHVGQPRLARVIERRFDSIPAALAAMDRGDVEMIADLPPRFEAAAHSIAGSRLIPLARPRVWLLQFRLDTAEMGNRTLRRAIAHAIDRSDLLERLGLGADTTAILLASPLPSGSPGSPADLEAPAADPLLARVLVAAATRELRALRPLTLCHPQGDTARGAARILARQLRLAGLDIRLVECTEDATFDPLTADLRLTSYLPTDPASDLVHLLARDNPSLFQHASPWLADRIAELVDVPNPTVAAEVLPRVTRTLIEDVALVPLWQRADRLLVSERIAGMPDSPASVYDRIAEWITRPGLPNVDGTGLASGGSAGAGEKSP